MIEKQEELIDSDELYITNEMNSDELALLLSNIPKTIIIDDDLSSDKMVILNQALQSMTRSTLALESSISREAVKALDLAMFKGWLELGKCSKEVFSVLSEKLGTFQGGLSLHNQELALNALSCSLKKFKGTLCVKNNLSINTAAALNQQLPHFMGILQIEISRNFKSIDWLNLSQFHGGLLLGRCSQKVIDLIANKLPDFPGRLPLINNELALSTLRLPLKQFKGILDIQNPLSEKVVEQLNDQLQGCQAILHFKEGVTKDFINALHWNSLNGAIQIDTDKAALCLLSSSLEPYKGVLRLGGDLSKHIIEQFNQQLPRFRGRLYLSHTLCTDAVDFLDLTSWAGEIVVSDALMRAGKTLKTFGGMLSIGNHLTLDSAYYLNQQLSHFNGVLSLKNSITIEMLSALNLAEYRGRLLLDIDGCSKEVLDEVVKKLEYFKGVLVLANEEVALLLWRHALTKSNGFIHFTSPMSKECVALLSKQLEHFNGVMVMDKSITVEALGMLNLGQFKGMLQLGLYEESVVNLINQKLKLFKGMVQYMDDELSLPNRLYCSLELFKGTLFCEQTLPSSAMNHLNEQLEAFEGTLYLSQKITPDFLNALKLRPFSGLLHIAKLKKEDLETFSAAINPFSGIIQLDDEEISSTDLSSLLKNNKGFLSLNHLSKKSIARLNPWIQGFKGGLYLDERMDLEALKTLNLEQFKGTLLFGKLSEQAFELLKNKLEKSKCALCFNRYSTGEMLKHLPRHFFSRKVTVADTSQQVTELLINKCLEFKATLYDVEGRDFLSDWKKSLSKGVLYKPTEQKQTPLPVSSYVEKKEPIIKKEKKESKKEQETRKIQERLQQKKQQKMESVKEKIELVKVKIEPVETKVEPVQESKVPSPSRPDWLSSFNPSTLKEFVPSVTKNIKPSFFFSEKKPQMPTESKQVIQNSVTFHSLKIDECDQYLTFMERERLYEAKLAFNSMSKALPMLMKRQLDKKKCPLELSETMDFLMNHSGVAIGNEFDRLFLLGRAVLIIQQLLEKKEWQSLRTRCMHLDKLRNCLVHYGLNAPVSVVIDLIKELHQMTQDPMEFHVDFSKSTSFEDLNAFAKYYKKNYQYEMELKLFLSHVISLLKLIKACDYESHSLENKIPSDVIKFSLCFLGELHNHMPLFMKQFQSHGDHVELIEFLLRCKKQVRNIEFHATEQQVDCREVIVSYAPYEEQIFCEETGEELIQSVKNFTLLLDVAEPDTIHHLKKNGLELLPLLEKWFDNKFGTATSQSAYGQFLN